MLQVDPAHLLWLTRQVWIKEWPDIHEYLLSRLPSLIRIDAFTQGEQPQGEFTSFDDYMRYGRD